MQDFGAKEHTEPEFKRLGAEGTLLLPATVAPELASGKLTAVNLQSLQHSPSPSAML